MKIYIGPYKNWFGPHQLAEKLCFWARKTVVDEYGSKDYPDYVFKLGEFLAYGKWRGIDDINFVNTNKDDETLLFRFLLWIETKRKRKTQIHIDPWDTWSMDHTLAPIILPMLKQLKATKHGAPFVDMPDRPEHLQCYKEPEDYNTDKFHFQAWDWVMDEMIYAFDCKANKDDVIMRFDSCRREDMDKEQERISNGFRLFGKYFENLWD